MTRKRTGDPWMPAPEYGRLLRGLSVNLIVRDVAAALPFYTEILGLRLHYSDPDFAALAGEDRIRITLHADHTYDSQPEASRLATPGKRGTGAEIRLMGFDADDIERRARALGYEVTVPAFVPGHRWRECRLEDRDGYMFAVGQPVP
jgi:catechol 2,3-dioxygenase-like lactoylglutathione lyase family enzyme